MKRVVPWVVVGAVALVLTLVFANPYGTLNQATYLLDPLHRASPELFHRDWFVSDTPPYLPAFGWLTGWMFAVDGDGTIAVLIVHVIVTLATYGAILWLVRAITKDVCVFVIVAAFTAVTMGRTLGGNYLVAGYLQPMSIATLGWVIAMAALARGQILACGVALALAGLVHVNYLVLGVGLFTLAYLARGEWKPKELALLLAPQLVVLAYYVPQLLAAAGPGREAVRILVEFHAPGHYAGGRLLQWLPELACWQLAAFAALPLVPEGKTLWRFSLCVLAVVVATTLLILTPQFQWITQVRWSRIAPFGQLACQILVVTALVRAATAELTRARGTLIALATIVAVLETFRVLHVGKPLWLAAIAIVVLVMFVRRAAIPAAIAVTALAIWGSPLAGGLTASPAGGAGELALEAWARTQTPTDALFLTPPGMARFRLVARRAVVADTKSPPLRPDLLVAWYRRLCAVVQVDSAPTHEWIEDRWAQMSPEQIQTVAHTFGADYIVVAATTKLPGTPVFANEDYAAYLAR